MTSAEAILVTLMPTLNMFLTATTTLNNLSKVAIQNNLSKHRRCSREISAVEFRYNRTMIFGIHSNFTYDSETYDIVKLYLSLDSSFFLI